MTAEIAILNRHAIALAADSKVTIGGARMSKTYDTVNKLFTLSKAHPVGVMIYGNADFMRYPWETIIKLYRKKVGYRSFDTISDWATDFTKFVRSFGKISKGDRDHNLQEVARAWFAAIFDEADATASARGIGLHSDDYRSVLSTILEDKIADIKQTPPWQSTDQAKRFIAQHGKIVDDIRDFFFAEFEDPELLKRADTFISLAILSEHPSPLASGIVIAGFGDKEYFPSFVSLECDGYIGNRLKIYEESKFEITRNSSGCMRAFAQGEMVQRFMNGIDPILANTIVMAFKDVLHENCTKVLEKYGENPSDEVKKAVEEAAQDAVQNLANNIASYTNRAYAMPIVEMISLLPKDELANLAESLVGLTSLKRRVSNDVETVGGAIDVALISKGDGFVWVKRKYYFPSELNPQFAMNYMSDLNKGADNGNP